MSTTPAPPPPSDDHELDRARERQAEAQALYERICTHADEAEAREGLVAGGELDAAGEAIVRELYFALQAAEERPRPPAPISGARAWELLELADDYRMGSAASLVERAVELGRPLEAFFFGLALGGAVTHPSARLVDVRRYVADLAAASTAAAKRART